VDAAAFNWSAGGLILDGTTPQRFEVAGLDLGQTMDGFSTDADTLFSACSHTNFSMGSLEVASTANVTFVNQFANTASTGCGEALYVHDLTLQSGAAITLDNCKVYYETLTDNGATVNLVGCGELLSVSAPLTIPPPSSPPSNRALAVDPPSLQSAGPGMIMALRVKLVDLQNPQPPNAPCCPAPNFSTYEFTSTCTDTAGCARWAGLPRTFVESQDNLGAGAFQAARLQCTPLYRDWSSDGLFYIVGAEVLPSSAYDIQQVSSTCEGREAECTAVSAALRITTARAGDIVANFNPPHPSSQPDALDVASSVNKFKNLPGAPFKFITQLQPNVPELNADLNALDIAAVVDSVKGFAYPFTGPCVCPSAVPCNTTACSTGSQCTGPYGPGATCVKTCTSGPNLAAPCVNNTHCGACAGGTRVGYPCDANADCPSSTCTLGACGPGFCRDRCGRCN
jgi:hypothetical protein